MCDIFEGRGAFIAHPPHPWAAPKKPILNRVNVKVDLSYYATKPDIKNI